MKKSHKIKALLVSCLAAVALPAYGATTITMTGPQDVRGQTFDLTNEFGTLDWAFVDESLSVNTKAGGNLISGFSGNTSDLGNDSNKSTFGFTDGTGPVSGSSLGMWINNDFNATVAAPGGSFTIYFWGTVAGGTGTLTATIGDVSASEEYRHTGTAHRYTQLFTIDVEGANASDIVSLNYSVSDTTGQAWNRVHTSAIAVIPEPSSALLVGLGSLALLRRRR